MRRPAAVVLASLVAGVALADTDKEWIDVRDLVPPTVLRLRPDPPVSPRPVGDDESKGRRIAGEAEFLAVMTEGDPVRWLDGSALTDLLAALPQTADAAVEFDEKTGALGCAPASRDAVTTALADIRRRVPAPIALRISLTRGGEPVLRAEQHVAAATSAVIADAVERSVVADYNVEIAQASSIGDPVLKMLRTGASAALCVTPMPDGRSAVVEAIARAVAPLGDGTIDLGHPGFGRADRCETAFSELASTFRVENGRPTTVAWTGRDGVRMTLEVEATWTAAPPPGDPAVVFAPLVVSRFNGFHTLRAPQMHDDAEVPDQVVPAPVAREVTTEFLLDAAYHDPVYAISVKAAGPLLVLPRSEARTAAQQFERFCAAADATVAQAQVDCVAVNVPAGAAVSIDGPLPAGAFVVASYSGPVVRGIPACCTGGTERRFLSDWDVEVAQSARTPDPKFEPLATGHFLDLDVNGGAVAVHLDLRRLDRLDRREMQLAVGRVSQGVQLETNSALYDPALPPERVAVEKPVVAQASVAGVIPLGADGTGSLRRAGPSLLGAGRDLVVMVRVK